MSTKGKKQIKDKLTIEAILRDLAIRIEIKKEFELYTYKAIGDKYGLGEKGIYHIARLHNVR